MHVFYLFQFSVRPIDQAGLNPIEVLLWSRGKTLKEVQERLKVIKGNKAVKDEDVNDDDKTPEVIGAWIYFLN